MVVVVVADVGRCGAAAASALVEDGQRMLRGLFWRVRAEVKRQVSKGRARKQRFSFRYDPLSYALNFDDGCYGFFC